MIGQLTAELIGEIRDHLKVLTFSQRAEVFFEIARGYCFKCGQEVNRYSCYCEHDE